MFGLNGYRETQLHTPKHISEFISNKYFKCSLVIRWILVRALMYLARECCIRRHPCHPIYVCAVNGVAYIEGGLDGTRVKDDVLYIHFNWRPHTFARMQRLNTRSSADARAFVSHHSSQSVQLIRFQPMVYANHSRRDADKPRKLFAHTSSKVTVLRTQLSAPLFFTKIWTYNANVEQFILFLWHRSV